MSRQSPDHRNDNQPRRIESYLHDSLHLSPTFVTIGPTGRFPASLLTIAPETGSILRRPRYTKTTPTWTFVSSLRRSACPRSGMSCVSSEKVRFRGYPEASRDAQDREHLP